MRFEKHSARNPRRALLPVVNVATLLFAVVVGVDIACPAKPTTSAADSSAADANFESIPQRIISADGQMPEAHGTPKVHTADHKPSSAAKSRFFEVPSEIEVALTAGDYDRAGELVLQMPSGELRMKAILDVTLDWVETSPVDAAHFARRTSPGAERRAALAAVIRQWREMDIHSASAWLNEVEPDPDDDGAVAEIAADPRLIDQAPSIALGWAESIFDADLRRESVETITERWAFLDEGPVRRYVDDHPTPEDRQRGRLFARIRQQTPEY